MSRKTVTEKIRHASHFRPVAIYQEMVRHFLWLVDALYVRGNNEIRIDRKGRTRVRK